MPGTSLRGALIDGELTLKTCRQFLPLSFNRLSSISIISTKSFLKSHVGLQRSMAERRKQNALVVRQLRELVHLGPTRAPWIVRSGIADLRLHVRVAFCVVLRYADDAFAEVLEGRHGAVGRSVRASPQQRFRRDEAKRTH